MAVLHIDKGVNQGQSIPLADDKTILGRNPDCHVVIPVTSVSREHAHIVRDKGQYFIEDKGSRNGTFVNDREIKGRMQLKANDKIRICDFQATFLEAVGGQQPPTLDDDEGESATTIEAKLSHASDIRLEAQPAQKLAALLEISANLSKTLNLDPLLPKIVDSLFQLFKQADRGFIIMGDGDAATGKLMPKVVKTRRPQDETNARFSKTIVRQCLQTAQAVLLDDAGAQFATSQSVVDFRIRSVMCTPLVTPDGKAFGVIQLDTQDRSKKFTEDDLKLLWAVANQAAIAMENATLHENLVAQERVKRDLELAQQVQLSFLPKNLPQVPGYEFFAHYEAALQVGGDYYGFTPLPDGCFAITLGDVAGKGIPAALLMAKLSSDARFCLMTEPNLANAVSKLNDLVYAQTSQMDRFITLAALRLDPKTHQVTIVSAGHPAPLLYSRADGSLKDSIPRRAAGVPMGMLEGYQYDSCEVQLGPGDSLLLFSDGVLDAQSVRGTEFQIKGIHTALAGGGPLGPAVMGDRIVKAVHQHAAGRSQFDDITLVCVGRSAE